jgi:hypothetical protein
LTPGGRFASIDALAGTGRKYELRRGAGVCLVALGLLLAGAGSARASVYWGATVSGETYGQSGNVPVQAAWDLFERHAGKETAILNVGQGWCNFDSSQMNAAWSRGTIPMVPMGLGSGVSLADVAAGNQDSVIRNWAKAAKAWGHPFFFAPWWEMNGTWYAWGRSPDFIAAWRHFHDLVVAEGATNVTWTWVPNSVWSDPGSDPTPYYPGDAYVDWTGLDTYNWGTNPVQPDRWINPDQTVTPTLNLIQAAAPAKPFLVLENASSEDGGNKTDWIREMLTTYLPHHPQIDAYLWFNWNFPKGSARADWQIESSAPAQQAFRQGIQSALYRATPPALPSLTKVPPPPAPSGGDGPGSLDLSGGGEVGSGPQVAVAPDGTATVVWSARNGSSFSVYTRRIGPDGVPEPTVQELSAPGADALAPQVAVAPDGTAVVTWIRFDGSNFVVQARQIAADGTLGPGALNYSGTGQDAAAPQLAVGADGTATIVWKRFTGSHYLVQERRMGADGSREANGHILSDSTQDAVEPQVALAADGGATVVWSRFDGADTIVQARRVAPDGTSEANTLSLSASGEDALQPQLVLDAAGVATVVWTRFDGSNSIVQARRISAAGVAEPGAIDLSAAGRDAAEPQIAIGPDGAATAVWDRFDGSNFVVQARRIAADGKPPGAALTLSASGRDAAEPQVAVAPDGATVVWSRFDGGQYIAQRRDLAADGSAGSGVANLSAAGRGASEPQVALAGEDAVTTIWKRFDGANDVVQGGTALPPPPPDPPSQEPPPSAPVTPSGPGPSGGGSTSTGQEPAARVVDSSFRIGKPFLDRKRGLARLPVTVAAPGHLGLRGGGGAERQVGAPGTAMLTVRASGAKQRRLQRHGAVALTVTVHFLPDGGTSSSQSITVRLKMKPR